MNSKLGNQLQHAYAVQTDSLQPKHTYVPWVTVNGIHTEDIENRALENLVKLICQTYKVIYSKIIYHINQ
jgi:interferon gamma-inducible protein 30